MKHLFLINQARATLHLSKKTLACTPHITKLTLREMARDYLSRYLHSPNEMMSARKKSLSIHLALFRSNRVHIAEMLALHPRTLQRRLEQEGTTFDPIKDELRKELALQYLLETPISMSQLASILEFAAQLR